MLDRRGQSDTTHAWKRSAEARRRRRSGRRPRPPTPTARARGRNCRSTTARMGRGSRVLSRRRSVGSYRRTRAGSAGARRCADRLHAAFEDAGRRNGTSTRAWCEHIAALRSYESSADHAIALRGSEGVAPAHARHGRRRAAIVHVERTARRRRDGTLFARNGRAAARNFRTARRRRDRRA